MLDVPYGTQVEGAAWHSALKTHVFVGRDLPSHLAPYAPGAHTLGRFIENSLNPHDPVPNPAPTGALEPRRIQYEAADAIAERAAGGGRQFLLADEPGVGKTISAVLGATAGACSSWPTGPQPSPSATGAARSRRWATAASNGS